MQGHRSWLLRLLSLRVWLAEAVRPSELQITLFWAGVVGFLGGVSSVVFRYCILLLQRLLTAYPDRLLVTAEDLPAWERLVAPTVGGLLAGAVLHFGMRLLRGQSSTDYMEAIALRDGVIRSRPSLVKSFSSMITIASGGSIGREGSMVQLGAWLASWVGRQAKMSTPRLRLLVACGAAAGIAGAYNAPIAGSLFVAEIILGSIAMESFGPLIFASVISTLTVRNWYGGNPIFIVPGFHLVSGWELIPYLVLGLATGVAAPAFLKLLRLSERMFEKLGWPTYLRLALGGLIVGVIASNVPEVWGNGYGVVGSILHEDWFWPVLAAVLVCKVISTSATFGSGAAGGIFTPTLFVGAAVGGLYGQMVHALLPNVTAAPTAYALVGMGCLLAGTTHAPLMAILMLFEMTLDYEIILPLMLGCVTAYYTAHHIESRSVYAESLRRKKLPTPEQPFADLHVRDLMKSDPPCVMESARFSEIAKMFVAQPLNYIYVTNEDGGFLGAISLHEIKAYLGEEQLANLVTAFDLLDRNFGTVTENTPLIEALEKFSHLGGERLPVINNSTARRLVGTISKTDVLLTLAQTDSGSHESEAGEPLPRKTAV